MKKILLLVAALSLFSATAFGAATDGTGNWNMTVPAQVASVYMASWVLTATKTILFTTKAVAASAKTFDLVISGGGTAVELIETANPTTMPDLYGMGTISGAGPYTVTTNATSGTFSTTDYGDPVTVEITLMPFTMSATEDSITNGTMFNIIGGGAMWTAMTFSGARTGFTPAIPIPAAFWLLASGFAGLVAIRRRKQG